MKSEFQEINEILKEFELCKLSDVKLEFAVFDDGAATYELKEEDCTHEVTIINENISFFPKMTIKELLEKTPFYVWHRVFDGDRVIGQKMFRMIDQACYVESKSN
jgi:hypothetical protein